MISIIIPTLNEEKVIGETVRQFKDLMLEHEVIISDGKSTDRTAELAREAGAKVLVHDKEYRQTISEGRNVGVKSALGDIIVFMDADCTIPDINNFFKNALAYFDHHPKLVGFAPSIYVLPELATIPDKIIFGIRNWTYIISNNVFHIHGAPGECLIMKKEAFEKTGGFRVDLAAAEDLDLVHRLAKIGGFRFTNSLIVLHTGRRAHKVGWPKLLWEWFANTMSFIFFKKAASKEWTVIR